MVAAGLEPLVVFWTGWGVHFMVLLSFMVQVTLLLVAGIRRRNGRLLLKVVIWSAYMLADTAAIYALGHMSVLCRSQQRQIMALWAPLLLVHLGGQDNITAYAIEDNRLWLRHLQTFVLQVAAAGYVLYVSSILSHPSKVRSAAILMFVVGVLKYGERIWALKCANSCASSSLSATSYHKDSPQRPNGPLCFECRSTEAFQQILAYSLLDVAKQMFEGPSTYVQIYYEVDNNKVQYEEWYKNRYGEEYKERNGEEYKERYEAEDMYRVVERQLSMMYDLLYTKAAVLQTWYGLCSRVLISLPFTVIALLLFRSSSMPHGGDRDAVAATSLDYYKRLVDVQVTFVLLVGAVVLETMSVLRAMFSKWTAIQLYARGLCCPLIVVSLVKGAVSIAMELVHLQSRKYWSGHIQQHSLFNLTRHSGISRGSKMAKSIGVEDWWDSNVYSWSIEVPGLAFTKVLELVSTTEDITGLNALRRSMNNNNNNEELFTSILRTMEELKLEERILVWHIATHVYIKWCEQRDRLCINAATQAATKSLANYMFFLLAARPYMLPYPVSRQAYVQLCHDALTHFPRYNTEQSLLRSILNQKEALMKGTPLQPDIGIGRRKCNRETVSMNTTLDIACQLAAKLIHIKQKETKGYSAKYIITKGANNGEGIMAEQVQSNVNAEGIIPEQAETTVHGEGIIAEQAETAVNGEGTIAEQAGSNVNGEGIITEQAGNTGNGEGIIAEQEESTVNGEDIVVNIVLDVWVEMLCYTAYLCNEKSHAKHLTDGGEFMTIVALLMIYRKNGLIYSKDETSRSEPE